MIKRFLVGVLIGAAITLYYKLLTCAETRGAFEEFMSNVAIEFITVIGDILAIIAMIIIFIITLTYRLPVGVFRIVKGIVIGVQARKKNH